MICSSEFSNLGLFWGVRPYNNCSQLMQLSHFATGDHYNDVLVFRANVMPHSDLSVKLNLCLQIDRQIDIKFILKCLLVPLSLTDVRCYFEHAKASERLQSFLFSVHSLISGKASHLSVTQSDCGCQLCTKRNQFGSRDTSIFLLSLKQTRFDCQSFNFKASSIRGG